MINLQTALQIVRAAREQAVAVGVSESIASVSNLVAFARVDNAWLGSIDIAIRKAWTARAFEVTTKERSVPAQPGQPFHGIHASNAGKVMIFAGGVPLKRSDQTVGAIGMSGGTGKQDQSATETGAEAFR